MQRQRKLSNGRVRLVAGFEPFYVLSPTYLGAVIVCQGGDSPTVKLAIVEAVSNATGLSADKITVLKMK